MTGGTVHVKASEGEVGRTGSRESWEISELGVGAGRWRADIC